MTAIETTARHCSWDSEPSPLYNMLTAGNVNEVLPGVTRPLPADLIAQWDWRFCTGMAEQLGVLDLVPTSEPPVMNVLGFVGGRWTLNVAWSLKITSTYQVGGGVDMLAQFVEGDNLNSGQASDQARAAATRKLITRRWKSSNKEIARQRAQSLRAREKAYTRNYTRLTDEQLLHAIDDCHGASAGFFITHVIVSVGGAEYTALLGALLGEHIPGHPAEWVTTLTSALTGVESARPGKAIWDLARMVGRRRGLAEEFQSGSIHDLAAKLASPPGVAWASFASAYRAFVEEFGFRGQRETDPSVATWDEASSFVLSAIQADLAAPPSRSPHRHEQKLAGARLRLEAKIEAKLAPGVRRRFREYLALAQDLNRNREATKANWARSLRNYRPPVLEIGRRLMERGVLRDRDDTWFLRLAELEGALAGTDAARLQAAVESRKAEYQRLHGFELPDGLFSLPVALVPAQEMEATSQQEFQGLGVSAGVATGRARIILSTEAAVEAHLEPGEVLIAPFTDAPWSPLFVPAGAIVVEVGGMLSHAATVAREYGVPAVAGIRGATKIIPDGALVTVDGNKGIVTIA